MSENLMSVHSRRVIRLTRTGERVSEWELRHLASDIRRLDRTPGDAYTSGVRFTFRSDRFGNSRSASHSVGQHWARPLLYRVDLVEHAARILSDAAVHHSGDLVDGSRSDSPAVARVT